MNTTAYWRSMAVLAWACWVPQTSDGGPVVSNLVAQWLRLDRVRCDVRRDTDTAVGRVRRLSRVHWAAPNRLYVENYSPVRRTIACDGAMFMSYAEGDPMGFACPVAELPSEMERSLRVVPGTPMDHLLVWLDSPESVAAASGSVHSAVRLVGPPAGQIGLDATGRLIEIIVFDPARPSQALATWRYRDYQEVCPGVWVPLLHEAWLFTPDGVRREFTRFENYKVGADPTAPWENPARYFHGVQFTNRFDAIYRQP